MNRQDLQLDNEGDLLIENGDFVIAESDEQHVTHLLQAVKGDYKQFPTTGCNLIDFIKKGESAKKIEHEITTQLKADGYKLTELLLDSDGNFNLEFDVNY